MAATPQEAAAAGLGWVDENHPLYGTPGYVGAKPATTPNVASGGAASGGVGGNSIPTQAAAASTYSNTPGATPAANTTNQGTQDAVRNSWLAQATQGTTVDPNDPNIKQQVDPFAAAQERSRRDYESQQAERLSAKGLGNSGALENERRYGMERAGQATGAFKSQLIGQELQNRRKEIQDALNSLGDTISNDQKNALTKQLADLDATIKREGIAAGVNMNSADNSVRDKLGTGALNVDLIRALMQNQQFGDSQALDWSQFDWQTNPTNPRNY